MQFKSSVHNAVNDSYLVPATARSYNKMLHSQFERSQLHGFSVIINASAVQTKKQCAKMTLL